MFHLCSKSLRFQQSTDRFIKRETPKKGKVNLCLLATNQQKVDHCNESTTAKVFDHRSRRFKPPPVSQVCFHNCCPSNGCELTSPAIGPTAWRGDAWIPRDAGLPSQRVQRSQSRLALRSDCARVSSRRGILHDNWDSQILLEQMKDQ